MSSAVPLSQALLLGSSYGACFLYNVTSKPRVRAPSLVHRLDDELSFLISADFTMDHSNCRYWGESLRGDTPVSCS